MYANHIKKYKYISAKNTYTFCKLKADKNYMKILLVIQITNIRYTSC